MAGLVDTRRVLQHLLPGVLHRGAGATPPQPTWDLATQVHWFDERRLGIPIGFGIIFVIAGMTAINNALIAYSMRRMSVSRIFGYSYLIIYSLSAIPGLLLLCIALIVGTLRPDRDPRVLGWLYDFAFLSFDGTMGCS